MTETDAATAFAAATSARARAVRARPMPVEERREAIARATLPLLIAHGRDVTTKQIAEASCVAEGTLFRVFPDKDAIVDAAVAVYLDPEPFRSQLRAIDPSLPLEVKLRLIVDRFHDRFEGIFGVFASLGMRGRPPGRDQVDPEVIIGIFADLLAPDLDRLRVPPAIVFAFVRMVAFASALPQFGTTSGLDAAELAHLITHGVAVPRESAAVPSEPTSTTGAVPC